MNDITLGIICLTVVFAYLVYLAGRRTCKVCTKNKKMCWAAEESCGFKMVLCAIVLLSAVGTADAATICVEGDPVDGKVPYSCTMDEPLSTYSMESKPHKWELFAKPKALPSVASTVIVWIAKEVAKEFVIQYLEDRMNKKVIVIPKSMEAIKSH